MKLKIFLILFIIQFGSSINLLAQSDVTLKQALKQKPKLTFRLGNRNSFISTVRARITAVKAGLEYDNLARFGIGYHWLASEINNEKLILVNDSLYTINGKLKLSYASFYGEYVFYSDEKWEFCMPLSFGFGRTGYKYNNDNYNDKWTFAFIYENNIMGQYKIIKYLGVGFGIGYRFILKNNDIVPDNCNSAIYVLKLKLFFGEIHEDIKT